MAALAGHRDRQRAEAAACGPGYHASGYVFTFLNGDPTAPDLWVPKTCATWADVWQMATGSIWRSMSVGPVLAWPEVG